MGGTVRTEKEGAVGWIVFDHPERRNAVSTDMWRAIPEAARSLGDDAAVRVVVLRGAGEEAFVSGADISEFESARSGERAADYDALNARAFAALIALDKPLLAMIHGFCVGGGMALALTADLRYCSDDARFAIPAARLGLGYRAEGIEILARLVGPSVAQEIFFTARRLSAAEALAKGLVNAVHPKAELEGRVRETADAIAANAPLTLRSVKLIVRELGKAPVARDTEAMSRSVQACFESDDYRAGVRAFLEKSAPRFRGR